MTGVVKTNVNYASEKASVVYVPGVANRQDLIQAVERRAMAWCKRRAMRALEDAGNGRARGGNRGQARTQVLGGRDVCAPLFLFSMARPQSARHVGARQWVHWLMLALATPVQFYVGGDYYVAAVGSPSATARPNMDVLVAMGSSAAYFYNLAILIGNLFATGMAWAITCISRPRPSSSR
ncbi:MAG: cation-translocating P-type ATPase [Anaerolineae bacterium]|uniref:hypothetical protein n=1 Tax=Candidatus Amarolinea dominans TaxID=3140696 RepID=UPI003134F3D1|nr:cation-translocating P-type ATPase [Anaerolineae bacterium]